MCIYIYYIYICVCAVYLLMIPNLHGTTSTYFHGIFPVDFRDRRGPGGPGGPASG